MGVPTTARRSSSSAGSAVLNLVARLLAWYGLYTVLFRCPANPSPDNPAVCQASHVVKTALQPHLQPYYDTYLSPYVDQLEPHVHRVNKVYVAPAYRSATASYQKHAEPQVLKGQKYAQKKYDRVLKPQIEVATKKARGYYSVYLQPHVATANEKYIQAKPHIDKAREHAEVFYADKVHPAYETALPHIVHAYEQVRYVLITVVAPIVRDGGEKAVGWGAGIWKDVIGPQVGRIGERLGGNGNGVPAASVSSSIFSSLSATDTFKEASSTASLASMLSSASSAKSTEPGKKSPTKEEVREIVENDLKDWTGKFQSAADKAAADLSTHINDLTEAAHVKEQEHVDKDLATLESLVESSYDGLKKAIIKNTEPLSSESITEEKEKALALVAAATRKTGVAIRDKAQAIRKESQAFLTKLYDSVAEAADSHMDVLDSVSDVGLQEIGMRWAWIDFVTYKDWQRYHDLKKSFQETRTNVVKSAESNKKLIEVSQWAEKEWEGKATEIAKHAAEELKRLKEVGKRKIELADSSDDFSNTFVPVAAQKAGQQVMDGAEKLAAAATDAKEDVQEKVESIVDGAKSSLDSAATKVSETVYGTEQPYTESVVSVASEAVEEATSKLSEKVYGTESGVAEKVATALSEAVLGSEEPTPLASSVASVASDAGEFVKSHVPGGVHAGFVAEAKTILFDEDDDTFGNKLTAAGDIMSEKLKDASRAVSDAIAGTRTAKGAGEKATSIASEKYAAALSAASSALYNTPSSGMVAIATDKYSAAVAAASSALYGTPAPLSEKAADQASAAYSSATSAAALATDVAEQKVLALQDLVSELIHGREPDLTESVMNRLSQVYATPPAFLADAAAAVQDAYSDAAAQAESSYSAAASYASSASAAAASAVSSAGSAAAAIMTPPPIVDEIVSSASSQIASALSAASAGIYGTQQGTWESATSVAASAASEASVRASQAVYGREKPAFEAAWARILEIQIQAVSRVSEAAYGATPTTGMADAAAASIRAAAEGVKASVKEGLKRAGITPEEKAYYERVLEGGRARIEDVVEGARKRYDDLLLKASEGVYGTQQGAWESGTSVAKEKVASATAKVKKVKDEL